MDSEDCAPAHQHKAFKDRTFQLRKGDTAYHDLSGNHEQAQNIIKQHAGSLGAACLPDSQHWREYFVACIWLDLHQQAHGGREQHRLAAAVCSTGRQLRVYVEKAPHMASLHEHTGTSTVLLINVCRHLACGRCKHAARVGSGKNLWLLHCCMVSSNPPAGYCLCWKQPLACSAA